MMRLICPNCGAQYEVPDDVIPAEGRDVQCSSCGNTWLERPGASVAEEEGMAEVAETVAVADVVEDQSADVAETAAEEPTPYAGTIEEAFADIATDEPPVDLPDTTTDFELAEGEIAPTEAPQRRPVDASVASILQEEAARETAAREAEAATGLEAQTDLGLDEIAPARTDHAEVSEPVQDEAAATSAAIAATVAGSRRELLPDIEEINSSLRSNAERGEDEIAEPEEIEAEKKRGFRTGFLTVLILLAILAALYIFAPQISEAVPAVAGALDSYVAAVDAGRIWLDVKANELLEMIRPAAEE